MSQNHEVIEWTEVTEGVAFNPALEWDDEVVEGPDHRLADDLVEIIEAVIAEGDDMGYLAPKGPVTIHGLRPVFVESLGLTNDEVVELADTVQDGKDYILAKTMTGEWGYLNGVEYEAELEKFVQTRVTFGDLIAAA